MPQLMSGVLVLIASPGDTDQERAAVAQALNDWNINRGRREGAALLPWLYERHSVPKLGGRAQAIINEQAVDRSDIVVAFFDSRLGTATGVDVSGTAEEITKAADAGKPVHVYFSDERLPRDVDGDQLAALRTFEEDLRRRGLLGSYSDPADLVGQVIRAIESDLDNLGLERAFPVEPTPAGADLRWEHVREQEARGLNKQGKMTYTTTKNELIVRNDGSGAAAGLTFEVEPVGDTEFAMPDAGGREPQDLPAHSSMSWLLIPTPSWGSTGSTVRVQAQWAEDGEPKNGEWTVTLS